MPKETINILQITDTHLFADSKRDLLGIITYDSFQAVIQHATQTMAHYKPNLIVFSGDISQDDSSESYQHLINSIKHFPPPIAWIPGNHDKSKLMRQLFTHSPLSNDKHFVFDNWQIILLDSHWPHHVGGKLTNEQLQFVDNTLRTYQQYAVIFLHHHVLPLGIAWIDPLNLQTDKEFLAIIDQYSHVRGVVCGHVHQDSTNIRNDIPFISTPSTCIQFKPGMTDFTVDTVMPGYRYLHLEPDGRIDTTLYRIECNTRFLPDLASKGY